MSMPAQRPGQSKQDYQSPIDFIAAVKRKWGINEFAWDLAASAENSQAPRFYDEEANSLVCDWNFNVGIGAPQCYLNPPFADIRPWVAKASQSRANVLMLVPASVGSNWWYDHVHRQAHVWLLNGRLQFVGHACPYIKDCALLEYNVDVKPGYDVWRWK